MKVDVLDMASVSEKFRGIIKEEYAVVQGASMLAGWKATTIGEFCPFSYGKGLPKRIRNENGAVAVYGSNGKVGMHDSALIDGEGIVIGRKGTAGAVHYSPDPFWPIDTTFYVSGNSESRDLRFTYYLLKSIGLETMNSDSAVPGLNRDTAHMRKIFVPELSEQRVIAHILGTLDDKIELNRRMNKTLEAMAQAIFKSWFVDFDPVHAKAESRDTGLPPEIAGLFPDAFEDSELGEIPKGWEVKALGEVAEITMGQSPPGNTYNTEGVGSPFYQGIADFQERYPKRRVFCTAPTRFAEEGDILLSVRAPIGRVNVATECCSIGRGLAGIRTMESADQPFLEFALRKESESWHILESRGSVFGNARKSDLLALPLLWPKPEPRHVIARILGTFGNTEQMNCTLAALRDTLLPVLLSGKTRRAKNHTVRKKPR